MASMTKPTKCVLPLPNYVNTFPMVLVSSAYTFGLVEATLHDVFGLAFSCLAIPNLAGATDVTLRVAKCTCIDALAATVHGAVAFYDDNELLKLLLACSSGHIHIVSIEIGCSMMIVLHVILRKEAPEHDPGRIGTTSCLVVSA